MRRTLKNCHYGESVLVTGASSGIGKATAELFAGSGFTVYAISRTIPEGEREYGASGRIHAIRADVTSLDSLKAAFEKIPKLNIVVHCAGFGIAGSAERTSSDKARIQFETNYFGAINVNSLAMPMLRKNKASLVIFTSSMAALVPIPYQSHYSSSKYALEAYAEALGMEARPFGVRVSIVEPGDTKTSFTSARKGFESPDSPYYESYMKAVSRMETDERGGASPEAAAKAIYNCAFKKRPKIRVAVGLKYKFFVFLIKILPVRLRDFVLIRMY